MDTSSASPAAPRQIHAFLASIERAFKARRIYSPKMAGHEQAMRFVETTLPDAVAAGGFTLRVTATELLLGREAVLLEERTDDSFFFPLYRDGLRELTFGTATAADDIESLLRVVEAEREGRLGYSDDTVGLLWRQGLAALTVATVDALPPETDETDQSEGSLASRLEEVARRAEGLLSAAREPAAAAAAETSAPAAGPTSATPTDPRTSSSLEPLPGEVESLLADAASEDQQELLGRFVHILSQLVERPDRPVDAEQIGRALQRVLDSYWTVGDHVSLGTLLDLLQSSAAARFEASATAAVERFANAETVELTIARLRSDDLDPPVAERIWRAAPDASWSPVFQYWCELKDGEHKEQIASFLRRATKARPFALKSLLRSPQAEEVRAALALLDEELEAQFVEEFRGLTSHPDPALRQKGIGLVAKHMGDAAFDLLWRSVQKEAQESVRLLALRHATAIDNPQLPQRLVQLITGPIFAERAPWERKKYVVLLGEREPVRAIKLFESWLPARRSFLRRQDLEVVELALMGMASAGEDGLQRVKDTAEAGGKVGKIATTVLAELSQGSGRA